MIDTTLVGLYFTTNGGTAIARGRVVARIEPHVYLCQIRGVLRLVPIHHMYGWTFAHEGEA